MNSGVSPVSLSHGSQLVAGGADLQASWQTQLYDVTL